MSRIMFSVTLILYLALRLRWLNRHIGKSGVADVEEYDVTQEEPDCYDHGQPTSLRTPGEEGGPNH